MCVSTVRVCMHVPRHCMHMEAKIKLAELCSFFPPCGSGDQVWQQAPPGPMHLTYIPELLEYIHFKQYFFPAMLSHTPFSIRKQASN